jgi:hypothetical protein
MFQARSLADLAWRSGSVVDAATNMLAAFAITE